MEYYIKGSKENAKQIENAFEKLGYSTSLHTFFDEDTVFITLNGNICECNYGGPINELIKTHPDYKELELPKLHYDIANFKPFDKVLVRDNDKYIWSVELFSFYRNKHGYPFRCVGNAYSQCIPYNNDTKHLLGTTDPCGEEYINW